MIQNEEYKKIFDIIDQIEEQVDTCCAVTMYPEDVIELIEKLRSIIKKEKVMKMKPMGDQILLKRQKNQEKTKRPRISFKKKPPNTTIHRNSLQK